MFSRRQFLQLTGSLVAAAVSCPAFGGSWFFFDPIDLEAEIRFDGDRTSLDGTTQSEGFLLQEIVQVAQSGYIWAPDISTFSLTVAPVFRQDRRTRQGENDRGKSQNLNYALEGTFLKGRDGILDGQVTSSRITNVNDAAFVVRNETDTSVHEFTVRWKNPYLPTRFTYSLGAFSQVFDETGGASRVRRDEDRQRYSIFAANSKLRLSLDSEHVDENVNGNDFVQNRASLRHLLRWGKGSHLRSQVWARERTGYSPSRQFNWLETAMLQHTDTVFSRTEYQFESQESFGRDGAASNRSDQHRGRFRLEHDLYGNLMSHGEVFGRLVDSDVVEQHEGGAGAGVRYRKIFFSDVDVSLNVRGEYRLTDRRTEQGAAVVIDERQVASFTERIVLGQPLVDTGTIRVTAEDGFTYQAGFDYEVLPVGNLFTELRIVPSGRISIGELLLVSYQYDPFPSAKFDTRSPGYGFSLGYRGFSLYHNSNRSNHELQSGEVTPPDRLDDTTGLEYSFRSQKWSGSLRAERRRRRVGGYESESLSFNQTISFAATERLSFLLTGSQVFTDSLGSVFFDPRLDEELQVNDISADFYIADASVRWAPRTNLWISPSLGYWKRAEEVRSGNVRELDQEYVRFDLRIGWLIRQLSLELRYTHNERNRDGSDAGGTEQQVDDRLMFSVRRQFL